MLTRLQGALRLVIATAGVAMLAPAAFADTPPNNPPPPVPDPNPPTTDTTTTTTTTTTSPTPPPSVPPASPTPTLPDPNVTPDSSVPPPVVVVPAAPTYSASDRQYETTTTEEHGMFERYGFALSAGGGVSGFTDHTARDATKDGGGWDIRAVIGTRLPVAAEVSYLGSAQRINALGLDNNAVLIGNGVQGDIRFNLINNQPFQPFIYGGAAWRRYDLTNTDTNTSDVADKDDVVEFPVGVGLAYHYQGLILDARGEYRAATNADLMPSLANDASSGDQASLHRWGVNANIGYEF